MPARPHRARKAPAARAGGVAASDLPRFRRRMLAWFRSQQRDLPWRHTHDPYRIWVSEIMLQQTRVSVVVPYYRRFLRRFPTVRHLARARVSAVLEAWAGLGYYSRARNLHRAARQIVRRHGGEFPRQLDSALALPGIGRYTAAAILSIAYDQPLAALDGNVARVLARLSAQRGDLRAPQVWRRLDAAAGAAIAADAPGDWNQAMMELGATVCTPLSPDCVQCPVSRWCLAHKRGLADKLPAARGKPPILKLDIAAAVLLDPRGRTLLVRSPAQPPTGNEAAIFSRLWQFPAVESNGHGAATLSARLAAITGSEFSPAALRPLSPARHTVTFRRIRLLPFLVPVLRLPSVAGSRTPPLSEVGRLATSSATRKIAAAALRFT